MGLWQAYQKQLLQPQNQKVTGTADIATQNCHLQNMAKPGDSTKTAIVNHVKKDA